MRIVPQYWDKEFECMSLDQRDETITLTMHKYLRYAYQNSVFYRNAFDRAGFRPEEIVDLDRFKARVPFLTHRDVIKNQRTNPPYGGFLAVNQKDIVRIYCAPGPLVIPFALSDMEEFINSTAQGLHICGARSGDICDVTSAYQWQLAGTIIDDGFRRIGCAVVPGGAGMARTHITIMKHLGATVFYAFPSFAMKLVQTAGEMGIHPATDMNVRLIVLATGAYSDAQRLTLEEFFNAEVRSMYGGAETGFVASECSERCGVHCFSKSIVEVVDPDTGRQVPDGTPGEIVLTDLSRRALPMIRYRTGDLTEGLEHDTCSCGRTSPRLGRLIGRTEDIPRVKGTLVLPDSIAEVLATDESFGRFQIILDRVGFADRLTVRVESRRSRISGVAKRSLLEDIRAAIFFKPEIEIVPMGAIESCAPILVDERPTLRE
ncbi:MAG: AMP-binding protein [Desulfomonilaceae bacterium]|nr:AMP-binding protein [Desulfomonilaceae bacterium]